MYIKISIFLLVCCMTIQLAAQKSESPANCPPGSYISVIHGDPSYDETVPPEVVPPGVVPPTTVDPEYRNITWIHGLGGSPGAWTEAATASQVGPQVK
jgi:hypothetical protein